MLNRKLIGVSSLALVTTLALSACGGTPASPAATTAPTVVPAAITAATVEPTVAATVAPKTEPTVAATVEAMPDPMTATQDIVETAVAAGNFQTLATALTAAGLVETLKGPGPFTVFAPTDEAFAKLPAGTVDNLLKDPEQLKAVLTYHVVAGRVMAADVVKLDKATTVQGSDVMIKAEGDTVMINDAKVIQADIMASNGIIHVINTVLLPPTEASASAPMTQDIVDTAVAAGSFTTLAKALAEAGLIETLKGEGPFTVFAPTDEAFAKLPAEALDNLLKDPEQLKAVLTYHVVPGKVMAADVVKLTKAATVQGDDLMIKASGGSVMINSATVTSADIEASNGVIHVIDTVLLPPGN